MFKNLKSFSIILCLILILALPSASPVLAQSQDSQSGIKIELKNLKINAQKVTGTLSLNNLSSLFYPQLTYQLILSAPATSEKASYNGKNVTVTTNGGRVSSTEKQFDLANNAQSEFNFELPFNNGLPQGDFSVTASVKTVDNSIIGYATSNIPIQTGNNGMLINASSCEVVVNGISYGSSDGPIIAATDNSEASCLVKNLNTANAQVSYEIEYQVGTVTSNEPVIAKYSHTGSFVFSPAQEQKISFTIPKVTTPQVYQGYIYMVDSAKNRISPGAPLRWIVGGASASIRSISLDKGSYLKDEKITVKVEANPSADLYWRGRATPGLPYSASAAAELAKVGTPLKDATLNIVVTDKAGLECGSETMTLPDNSIAAWTTQTFEVTSSRDCSYPQVKTSIEYQGKSLAQITKNIPVLVSSANPLSSPTPADNKRVLYWILGIIFVIALGVGSWLFIKKKKGPGNKPQSPNKPVASDNSTVKTTAILLGLLSSGLITIAVGSNYTVLADSIVKPPVNNPIDSNNIILERGKTDPATFDNFYSNYTNFTQVEASGSSSINPDPNCSAGAQLLLAGWSGSANACDNKKTGLRYIVTIDGQPAQLSKAISNDSETTDGYVGANSFDIFGIKGMRTASISANLAGGLKSGSHKIEIKVIGLGLVNQYHSQNGGTFYSLVHTSLDNLSDVEALVPIDPSNGLPDVWVRRILMTAQAEGTLKNCGTTGTCYGLLSYEWSCTVPTPTPPPPACNEGCTSSEQCQRSGSSCTQCLPNSAGTGNTCQPPPACNVSCTSSTYCQGASDGCTSCLPSSTGGNTCQPPPACNANCTSDAYCQTAQDGCTSCLPNASGSGSTCQPPPACGTSCTTKAQCSGAKDGCSECLEGSCTDYSDNMCKCDSIIADIKYPSNAFNFEAFGKVMGADKAKAEIADITFRMTKNNGVVIARSNPITPQIVENTDEKIRFKAAWQTPPPPVDKNATYQVFADVRCKPKRIISAEASKLYSPNPQSMVISLPPKGLEFIFAGINKLTGNSNNQIKSFTDKALAMFATSTVYAQGTNLQLQTLNFVKMLQTDNCRMVQFKYDETLF